MLLIDCTRSLIHVPIVLQLKLLIYFSFLLCLVRFFCWFLFFSAVCEVQTLKRKKNSLSLSNIIYFSFPDSSYGSSSVVVNARSTSVTENLLDDKELREDKFKSEEVLQQEATSPIDSKHFLSNVIVHTSDKNCGDFESERESETLYAPVEAYQSQNNYFNGEYQASDLSNWPYDLSRTSLSAKQTRIDYTPVHDQYQNSQPNLNFRNLYNPYVGAMKGNLITMCQFNDILSPPSSVSSSSGYEFSDNNNNSFINFDQTLHLNAFDEEDFREEFKTEHCFLVEDANAGNYTTLTNATASAAPLDLYHLHDYQRNYQHNHSTSSGGDSRSPDGYNNEDYEHNFTQLTNLTTSRSNGIYAASPNNGADHNNIMSYDSTHVLSPARWVLSFLNYVIESSCTMKVKIID